MWKYGSLENIFILIFKREGSVASEAALFLYNKLSNHHSNAQKLIRLLLRLLFEGEVSILIKIQLDYYTRWIINRFPEINVQRPLKRSSAGVV